MGRLYVMTPRRRQTIFAILLVSYIAIILGVVEFGLFTKNSVEKLQTVTESLYIHPFSVNHAAGELKTSLFELRHKMVQIILIRNQHDDATALEQEVAEYQQRVKMDLEVIKSNFLGDMNKVREFELKFAQLNTMCTEIFTANQHGDVETAERILKEASTKKFHELVPIADYILEFAQDKAKQFVGEAQNDSYKIQSTLFKMSILLITLIILTAAVVLWRVFFLQKELNRQATTDVLTGIPNRRHFMEIVNREIERAKRYHTEFALAIVDLDFFKSVNDNHGHQVGDDVLKKFCVICEQSVRASDIVGRVGGEEFGILLPNTSLKEAEDVLERVRLAVEKTKITTAQGQSLQITASFGVTNCFFEKNELDILFAKADEALYRAKHAGRNQVCTACQ